MKLRLYAVMLGASLFALAACGSDETETGDNTGGGGGTGNEGGSTGATGGGGTGNEGGSTGGGGTGGGGDCDLGTDGCVGCAEYITFEDCTTDDLCAGSQEILDAINICSCGDETTAGACETECADACSGGAATPDCQTCAATNCADEVTACTGDVSD